MLEAILAALWVLKRLLPAVLFTYLAIISSGFIHEAGHIAIGNWVGIEVSGFSATDCLRLQCKVFPLDPLEGWRGHAVQSGGGLVASLWWVAIYLVTRRWHRTEVWWLGAASATFLAGELATALLEGGVNQTYSHNQFVTLPIILLAVAGGFFGQLKVTGQLFRIRMIWQGLEESQRRARP